MTPPLPSLRALTRELRDLHDAYAHPDSVSATVTLCLQAPRWYESASGVWHVTDVGNSGFAELAVGREDIPGDGDPFDAVAAARRLLAAARDAGYR